MIDLLFQAVYFFLNGLISIFPSGSTFGTDVHSAFSTLGSYFGVMDSFVPINTLFNCLLLVFGVEIAIFGFKTLKWVISHIPMIGGKGNI